jgi:FSR family fosmidomycin resistance protein-like MFS transporter
MVGLSAGHGVKHFYQQTLLLLLPHIKDALLLSDVAVGGIVGARAAAMGVMNIPAGVLTDMFRSRIAIMLAGSMTFLTIGYILIGLASNYWLILIAVAIAGAGTSMWHAPAFTELAVRYPERRAFAIAAHRSGGSIGDSSAPFIIGILLGGVSLAGLEWGGLDWRTVALLHAGPAAVTGAVILIKFKSAGAGANAPTSLRDYLRSAQPLFRNPTVFALVSVTALRGMAHTAFATFLVLYLSEDLSYSDVNVGFHLGLLTLFGILAGPLMGTISDHIGRRPVILFGLITMSVLIFAFLWADDGIALTITLALLGVVLFSVNPIMLAAAMESVADGSEGSAVAMLFTGGAIVGAISPVLAGAINSTWDFEGVIIYAGCLTALAALIAALAPLRQPGRTKP